MMNFDLLDMSDSDLAKMYGIDQTRDQTDINPVDTDVAAPSKPNDDDTERTVQLVGTIMGPEISIYEAKLRIFDCCYDLGISTTQSVMYPAVQEVYRQKFKASLNKDELKKLFGIQKAKAVFEERFRNEILIETASDETVYLSLMMYPDKDINAIMRKLEELTMLDKFNREGDVEVVPQQPTIDVTKPKRLLPDDFKVVDCRSKNSKANTNGINAFKYPGSGAPLRDILDTIEQLREPLPMPEVSDVESDDSAAWRAQQVASDQLAEERTKAMMNAKPDGLTALPNIEYPQKNPHTSWKKRINSEVPVDAFTDSVSTDPEPIFEKPILPISANINKLNLSHPSPRATNVESPINQNALRNSETIVPNQTTRLAVSTPGSTGSQSSFAFPQTPSFKTYDDAYKALMECIEKGASAINDAETKVKMFAANSKNLEEAEIALIREKYRKSVASYKQVVLNQLEDTIANNKDKEEQLKQVCINMRSRYNKP